MKIVVIALYFIRLMWVVPLRGVACVWPRSKCHVVIGAWMGNLYIDNPKYLCEHLLKHTGLKVTWIGNEGMRSSLPISDRLRFARKGSLRAFFALLRAKTWICCQAWNIDLTTLPIKGRATIIDTWHGIPVKFVGANTADSQGAVRRSWLKKFLTRVQYEEDEWLLISSEKMARILTTGVPSRYSMQRLMRFGTPRNDFLIKNSGNKELIDFLKKKYATMLGIDPTKKLILYLPTWRKRGDCVFAFYNQPESIQHEWRKMLENHNAVLVEKHHYGTYAKYPMTKPSACSVVVSAEQQRDIDVQELMLVADLMISDYSGAYIDYALMKRPVVHFAYDLVEYMTQDSGLAYDLGTVAAGPIVRNIEELKSVVDERLRRPRFEPASGFADLVAYEQGNSCEQIIDFILKRRG